MAIWQKALDGENKAKAMPGGPRGWTQAVLVPLVLAAFVALWALLVRVTGYPPFILPGPERVLDRLVDVAADGTLARHAAITLGAVLGGLAVGAPVAFGLGYLLSRSRAVERLAAPYIVASQAIPVVAIAPLLVIWFGTGIASKIIVSALTVFFPILISCIAGLRSAEPDWRDLMRSLEATRWQTFTKLELPAAMPMLIAGLKVGATLSVIGAVVGEFVGADRGLGFLVKQGQGIYDTPLMFVAVLTLVVIAMALYGAVALVERYWLAWKQ